MLKDLDSWGINSESGSFYDAKFWLHSRLEMDYNNKGITGARLDVLESAGITGILRWTKDTDIGDDSGGEKPEGYYYCTG